MAFVELFLVFVSGFASYFLAKRHQKNRWMFLLIGLLFPIVGFLILWITTLTRSKDVKASQQSEPTNHVSSASASEFLMARKTGGFFQEVVGESNYFSNIKKVVGKNGPEVVVTAELVREPNNRFDNNAVRVDVSGLTVGYIPSEDARDFHELLNFAARQKKRVLVQSRVWSNGQIGSVRLDIGDPSFCVLVNPEDFDVGSICWPYGSKVQVTKENEYLTEIAGVRNLGFSEQGCTAYFQLAGEVDVKNRPQVSVLFRGSKVGELSSQASTKYWPVLEKGLIKSEVFAIGEVRSNSVAAEIILFMKPPEQLNHEELGQLDK